MSWRLFRAVRSETAVTRVVAQEVRNLEEPPMSNSTPVARVAVVQAAPAVFDRDRTIQKLEDLTADCARRGAKLAVFPEAFVSGYPRGLSFGTVTQSVTTARPDIFQLSVERGADCSRAPLSPRRSTRASTLSASKRS
jgi:hypothetical protein